MPIYEYQCRSCGQRSEVMQRVSDPPLATCDECGGDLRKLISAPAFQFKGSGWYVTDYARKDGGDKKPAEKSKDDSGDTGKSSDASSDSGSDSGTKPQAASGKTKVERMGPTGS